jgi:serine protease DegS
MKPNKLAAFLLKSVIVGLAIAFLVMLIKPEWLGTGPATVEFREAPSNEALRGQSGPFSYAQAVEAAAPSVINVYTAKIVTEQADPITRFFFGDDTPPRQRLENSLGSGVVVSDKGFILTNNHVIDGADQIEIALQDGRSAAAMVVGADPESDLAVLKTDLADLPAITLGQTSELQVGDVVLAIGNPFGVGQTVTMGIVSATGRTRVGISTYESFIQTDAAINPGNSGGALINPVGQLVGINTAIFSRSGGSQGIGFAIPMSIARDVMQQIIENGHVVRGWLGVEAQDITPRLADSFNLKSTKGAIVAGVLRNGPADKMGLRPGDVITHINTQPAEDSRAVMNMIARLKPETEFKISILRNGKAQDLQGKAGERPLTTQQNPNGR